MATQIEQNTTDLQSILDAVNALPEGGVGGVEKCTVTIDCSLADRGTSHSITFLNDDSIMTTKVSAGTVESIVCNKNQITYFQNYFNAVGVNGSATIVSTYYNEYSLIHIYGDSTISFISESGGM